MVRHDCVASSASSGNICRSSSSTASQTSLDFDEDNSQKQRTETKPNSPTKINHYGRGGAGNIHAAINDQFEAFDRPKDPEDEYEQMVLRTTQHTKQDKYYSTGRGGQGNFAHTRSRSTGFPRVFSKPKSKKEKLRHRRFSSESDIHNNLVSMGRSEERVPTPNSPRSASIPPDHESQPTGDGGAQTGRGRIGEKWWKLRLRSSGSEKETNAQRKLRAVQEDSEFVSFFDF